MHGPGKVAEFSVEEVRKGGERVEKGGASEDLGVGNVVNAGAGDCGGGGITVWSNLVIQKAEYNPRPCSFMKTGVATDLKYF